MDLLITALETKGLVRALAEPNLIALSGDSARFLAGGEIPVPSVQPGSGNGVPTITTQYKPFGVELAFVPTVLSRGTINLRIEPSVSELDFANAVTIAGTQIPALTSRSARTTVELRDGQSFAVAGLLQTRNVQSVSQLPWIGSVPVLGTLFSSKSYQQQETDLVIIVTPRLVAPAVPGQRLASPLDSRLPANDVDFFLNGQMDVRKRYNDYVNSGGDVKGPYGHIIAPDVRLPYPIEPASRKGPQLRKREMTIKYLALLAPFLLGGCYGVAGHDEMERYVQRSDTITMSAGDAKQVNAVTHTINPWPPNVADRRIAYDARRVGAAVTRYSTTYTAGGSASRYRRADESDGPAASQQPEY